MNSQENSKWKKPFDNRIINVNVLYRAEERALPLPLPLPLVYGLVRCMYGSMV